MNISSLNQANIDIRGHNTQKAENCRGELIHMHPKGTVVHIDTADIEVRAAKFCAAMVDKARRQGWRGAVIDPATGSSLLDLGSDRLLSAAAFQKPGEQVASAFAIVVRDGCGEQGNGCVCARLVPLGRRTVTPSGTLLDPSDDPSWRTDEVETALDRDSPTVTVLQ